MVRSTMEGPLIPTDRKPANDPKADISIMLPLVEELMNFHAKGGLPLNKW
jgi:hypothetical protein